MFAKKDNTRIAICDRHGQYTANPSRPARHTAASIYTIMGANDGPRSYGGEDSESYEEDGERIDNEDEQYDEWLDTGDIDDDSQSQEDTTVVAISHVEGERQREREQWVWHNDQCNIRCTGWRTARFPLTARRTVRAPRRAVRSFDG